MAVSIGRLSFEHYRVPLGINEPSPRISWRFEGTEADWEQTGYDLEVKVGSDGLPEIFSVNSSNSVLVPWPASPLTSGQSASVRVRVSGGQSSTPWSDTVSVETGLLDTEDWAGANVIAADKPTEFNATHRPVHFRQTFTASSSAVRSARLYITALGMYEAEINGQRVGDAVLAPGWQSYNHCHAYDTYDVTEFVQDGQNAIGILGGEGWYSGRLGYGGGRRNIYGDTIGVLSLLKITYEDGSTQDALTRTAQRKMYLPISLGSLVMDPFSAPRSTTVRLTTPDLSNPNGRRPRLTTQLGSACESYHHLVASSLLLMDLMLDQLRSESLR